MTNQPYNGFRAQMASSNSRSFNGQEHHSLSDLSPKAARLRRQLRAASLDAGIVFDLSSSAVISRVLRRARVVALSDMTDEQLAVAVRYVSKAADTGEWPDGSHVAQRQALRDVKAILRRYPALINELRA